MRALVFTLSVSLCLFAQQQSSPPAAPAPSSTPLTISFAEALQRARQYAVELQTANIAALLAREDRIQAKAALKQRQDELSDLGGQIDYQVRAAFLDIQSAADHAGDWRPERAIALAE